MIERMVRGIFGAYPEALLIDDSERGVRILRIQKSGDFYRLPGGKSALSKGVVYHRKKFFGLIDCPFIMLREGDITPLAVTHEGFNPMKISQEEMDAIIENDIAIRIFRHGMDWKIIVIAVMGIAILGLALGR